MRLLGRQSFSTMTLSKVDDEKADKWRWLGNGYNRARCFLIRFHYTLVVCLFAEMIN